MEPPVSSAPSISSSSTSESQEHGLPNTTTTHLTKFKKLLIESLLARFTTDKEGGEKVVEKDGKTRNIFTINLFFQKSYILATVLDPRLKLRPFLGKYTKFPTRREFLILIILFEFCRKRATTIIKQQNENKRRGLANAQR